MESALPTRGIHAVLCVCPSAGHLDTKKQGERQPASLLNLVRQGGHSPGGETMPLYSPADNLKIQGADFRGWPVPMRGSQDDAGCQALCTIGAERWWMPQILRQYSSMARSDEKVPIRTALRMDILAQAS